MTKWNLGLRKFLAPEELAILMAMAKHRARSFGRRGGLREHTTWLAARLGVECGLRASEICRLRIQDLDVADTKAAGLYVGNGKCGSNGVVMMPSGLAEHVRQYQAAYRKDAPADAPLLVGQLGVPLSRKSLNLRMRGLLVAALGAARRSELSPVHCLRHTAATTLYATTQDLRLTQLHLRHSSPVLTQVYANVLDARRRAGVEQAFGGA